MIPACPSWTLFAEFVLGGVVTICVYLLARRSRRR